MVSAAGVGREATSHLRGATVARLKRLESRDLDDRAVPCSGPCRGDFFGSRCVRRPTWAPVNALALVMARAQTTARMVAGAWMARYVSTADKKINR